VFYGDQSVLALFGQGHPEQDLAHALVLVRPAQPKKMFKMIYNFN
jgi:hypothetical protein